MYVNVNNGERPDFGETAKTTTSRVLQRYFDYVEILFLQYNLPITFLQLGQSNTDASVCILVKHV